MEAMKEVAVQAGVVEEKKHKKGDTFIKVISGTDDHIEIVVQTVIDNFGRMKSATRHIHKWRGGGWSGINSSDEVVEAHKEAAKATNAAEKQYETSRLALENADKAHKEAVVRASRDAGDKARKAAEDAKAALEKAKKVAADDKKKLEVAKKKWTTLEKKNPLRMSYALDIHNARYAA